MGKNDGGTVSDPVKQSGRQEVDGQLDAKIDGNEHSYFRQRDSIAAVEGKKQQRSEIIHDSLHDIAGKAGDDCFFISVVHKYLL